jgi:hypothetical protein
VFPYQEMALTLAVMPDAAAGEVTRVQVVLPSATGLPKDDVVNTFHFRCATITDEARDQIRDLIRDFYNVPGNGVSMPIGAFISTSIDRTKPVKVKCYDLSDPIVRNAEGKVIQARPVHETSFPNVFGSNGSGKLPDEVAVTLSYYSERNIPRRRGRIFLGPLDRSALATDTFAGDTRVTTDLVNTIKAAAYRLAGQVQFPNVQWGVFSTTDNTLKYPVTAGWVDNAFDTVRKRGVKANLRGSWAA